jgi:hypothetical protein
MHALPAVVPEGEFPRSEIVPVRLARRVAPLFGVRWAHNPWDRTWVCDFSALTLAEIARGAPLPAREEPLTLDGAAEAGENRGCRGVHTEATTMATPIANATLNRFGPHTKSAVVLTAANRLLTDATAAVTAVCRDAGEQPLPRSVRLAMWAGLVLEVFRAQPALVVAAIQARSVQRSLTAQWNDHVACHPSMTAGARSEIGAVPSSAGDQALAPVRFALIDDTLAAVNLSEPGAPPIGAERRDDLASAWVQRLLRMGRPGSGMVWLHEDDHGHRTAHAYQRVGAMVSPFVADALDTTLDADVALPLWPGDEDLDEMGTFTVRAYAIGLHTTVNYLRYLETPAQRSPELRASIRDLVDRAATSVIRRLGENDPAGMLLTGYAESIELEDLLRERDDGVPEELPTALERQLNGLRRTRHAWRTGRLAPGTTSYLLEIGCVALGAALDRRSDAVGDDLRRTITRTLARTWRETLAARGIPEEPASALSSATPSQIFHLYRYAEHLARRGGAADVRRALTVLDAVAEVRDDVAQSEPASIVVKHTSARQTHELACHVAWRLRTVTPPRERAALSRAAAAAERHLRVVLADPSTTAILAAPGNDRTLLWALEWIGPALIDLLRRQPEALTPVERDVVSRMLAAAGPTRTHLLTELAEALLDAPSPSPDRRPPDHHDPTTDARAHHA